MERESIARIFQDVVHTLGVRAEVVRIERGELGWRIQATDRGDRLISVLVPDGPPDAIRATLTRWAADDD